MTENDYQQLADILYPTRSSREWKDGQKWRFRTVKEILSKDGLVRISFALVAIYVLIYSFIK